MFENIFRINHICTDGVYTITVECMIYIYIKFGFEIQIQIMCLAFGGESIYTVSIQNINSYIYDVSKKLFAKE